MSAKYLLPHRDEIISLVDSSTAWQPYAHHMRALLDPRPLSERIRDAVVDAAGALRLHHDPRNVPGIVEQRIAANLHKYPLDRVPCRPVIADVLAEESLISVENST